MSDDIENKFGLDASAALAALAQLDTGFAKLAASMTQAGNAASQFNSASANAAKQLGSPQRPAQASTN